LRNFFDGAGRNGAENEGDAERCGGAADSNFRIRMNDVLHADGAQQNWRGQSLAEEFDGEVALGNVAQHARDDPPAIEGGEIRAGGAFPGGASGDVVIGLLGENFSCFLFRLREWNGDGESLPCEAELVDLELALHTGTGGVGVRDRVGRIGHGLPRAL
jgi:hypothetical protein